MNKLRRIVFVLGVVLILAGSAAVWKWGSVPEAAGSVTLLPRLSGRKSFSGGSGEGEVFSAERPEVGMIVAPGATSSAERLRLVHALPDDLSEAERGTIADFLKQGENSAIELVIKNDLMNKLRNQKTLPPELTGVLLDLYADRKQNITVRIYALQHLRPQYELTRDAAIREVLYGALNETENEIAGGALLALRYLCVEYPEEFDAAFVSRRAAEIASDERVNNLTRLSAVQVAAMLNRAEIEPVIRGLAENASTPLTLRLAAIAGLGQLRRSESRPVLEELAGGEGPVGNAARVALRKFQAL